MTQGTRGNTKRPGEGTARRASRADYLARTTDPRPLLTVRGTADRLACSTDTVYRLIRRGELRAVRLTVGETRRGDVRVHPADLDAYLERTA